MRNEVIDIVSKLLVRMDVSKPVGEQIEFVQKIIQTINVVTSLPGLEKELSRLETLLNLSNIIYTQFSECKKEKIEEIYNSIQSDINDFYLILHPDDPHKDVEIKLDLVRRASTDLSIESFGIRREDPKALISEGHQDSLGLCIFFAFVSKFNKDCSLMVLDDVVTTIDRQHRRKICDLLEEYFKDFQLIITTHDEVWFEQIRRSCSNFKIMEIIRWSAETGPIIEPFLTRWEKICEKLDAADKEGVATACRQYIEWLLFEFGKNILAKVTIKSPPIYTLKELMDAVYPRLRRLLQEGGYKEEVFKYLDAIQTTSFMANILLHNNPLASELSIEEIREFCHFVNNLHQLFSCTDCSKLLMYYQDRKRICCPNPKCESSFEIKCK